ncbi:hypothetical protein F5Y10DRAFT_258059 [Nemania abortiva]|nr:hypothetical protein F5Y10DRAFT_258059 [Nemania abortiva]
MSNTTYPRIMELASRWREAATQITGFVKTVKLSVQALHTLGPDGEAYFKEQATLLSINYPEFIYDQSNPNRVYFGNPMDIKQETNGFIYRSAGMRFSVLQPGCGGNAANSPGAGQSPNNVSRGDAHGEHTKGPKAQELKEPPSGFMRFGAYYWEQLRAQHPELHQNVILSVTKSKWSTMSHDEKEKWLAPARAEMEEFQAQNPVYSKDQALGAKRKQAPEQEDRNQCKRQKTNTPPPLYQNQSQMGYQAPVPVPTTQQPQMFTYQGYGQMMNRAPAQIHQAQQPIHQSPMAYQPHILTPHTQQPQQLAHGASYVANESPVLEIQNPQRLIQQPEVLVRPNHEQMVYPPPVFMQKNQQPQEPAHQDPKAPGVACLGPALEVRESRQPQVHRPQKPIRKAPKAMLPTPSPESQETQKRIQRPQEPTPKVPEVACPTPTSKTQGTQHQQPGLKDAQATRARDNTAGQLQNGHAEERDKINENQLEGDHVPNRPEDGVAQALSAPPSSLFGDAGDWAFAGLMELKQFCDEN